MKENYNQKVEVSAKEFGFRTYSENDSFEDPYSSRTIRFNLDLAREILEFWGFNKHVGFTKRVIEDNLIYAEGYKEEWVKAHYIWTSVFDIAYDRLEYLSNRALVLQYDRLFEGYPYHVNDTHTRIFIYRDTNSKGIIKLSNAHQIVPAIQLQATSEIDLETTVKKMRSFIKSHWNCHIKQKCPL